MPTYGFPLTEIRSMTVKIAIFPRLTTASIRPAWLIRLRGKKRIHLDARGVAEFFASSVLMFVKRVLFPGLSPRLQHREDAFPCNDSAPSPKAPKENAMKIDRPHDQLL